MTRYRMYEAIREQLAEEGLELTDDCKAAVDASVCAALGYVLNFSQEVSRELASKELYSEAMVAGVFINKLKGLMK